MSAYWLSSWLSWPLASAHRPCNAEKGDRTPREWLEGSEPEKWERLLQVIRGLPYNKQRKFQQKDVELDEFVERQLRDTAYISRCVTQYLRCLGATVACPRGQMTADLRHWWGLNTILDLQGRGEKNRALANARGENMPVPWEGFRDGVDHCIGEIIISHRSRRRLSGSLHEATIYGRTQKFQDEEEVPDERARPWAREWIEREGTYVRRKPVSELTNTKHLAKIRDRTIRGILRQHLRDRGVDPDEAGKIPSDLLKGDNAPRMPSGVPIKRVRMLEESSTFRRVSPRRPTQYVKPGSNHHIVYRVVGEGADAKWTAEVVPMWDAARRVRSGRPLVDRSDVGDARFLMSLSIGEMFEIDGDNGTRLLCVVRKVRQDDKRLNFKLHTDARQSGEIEKDNLCLSQSGMQIHNARKVIVDPLGRIRWAND